MESVALLRALPERQAVARRGDRDLHLERWNDADRFLSAREHSVSEAELVLESRLFESAVPPKPFEGWGEGSLPELFRNVVCRLNPAKRDRLHSLRPDDRSRDDVADGRKSSSDRYSLLDTEKLRSASERALSTSALGMMVSRYL